MEYQDMTDEEYDALDEELTQNPPKLGPNGTGWITQRELYHLGLKNMTVQYLFNKAKIVNKSPIQIIDELVSKEIVTTAM